MKKIKPKIYFKYKNRQGKWIYTVNPSKRRVGHYLASDKWEVAYLRIRYGREKGELVENEMISSNRSDLQWGLNNFLDKYLWLEDTH